MTKTMGGGSAFASWLSRHHGELEDVIAGPYEPERDAELERYLYGPLRAFSANGGKRVRPLICVLACRAVGGQARLARVSAAAIEQFQAAALIHDDIADEGELRRGKPCVHRVVGEGLAINCGDTALVNVFGTVAADERLDAATRVRVLGELHQMSLRTLEGQALDLGWSRDGRWDLDAGDYLRMATLKTAHYSCAVPLAVGAICGGGTDEQIESLRRFGLDAGLAFQIQDDLLNLVGDEQAQGKDFRSDVTEGKRTLAALWALTHAVAVEREQLVSILSAHETDPMRLGVAVRIMRDCGAIEHAREVARDLAARSKRALSDVELADEPRELLLSMADFFVERAG